MDIFPTHLDELPSIVYIAQHPVYTEFINVRIANPFNSKHSYTKYFLNNFEALEELLLIQNLEMVVFSLIEIDGDNSERKKYQTFCGIHEINFGFIDLQTWLVSTALMPIKFNSNFGDRVACLLIRKTKAILYILTQEINSPNFCSLKSIQNIDFKFIETAKNQILASNPTKIILTYYEMAFINVKAIFEELKNSFKNKQIEIFINENQNQKNYFFMEMIKCLHLIQPNNNPPNYFLLPVKNESVEIYGIIYASQIKELDLIKNSFIFIDHSRDLFHKESIKIEDVVDDLILYSLRNNCQLKRLKILKKSKFENKCVRITLKLDKYRQPDLGVDIKRNSERCENEIISSWNLGSAGNALINFDENSFEICIKTKNGYNWVLDDQGNCQIPCSIAFADNQVMIGKEAINNSFAINDIINLISASFENSQLVEFDTFRGRRKATPSFLFAFIIKWCLKEIEKVTNEIPKSLEFCFEEINENIEKNIRDACKTLDIEAKVFDRNGLKAAIAENEFEKIQRLKKAWLRPMLPLPLSEIPTKEKPIKWRNSN